MNRSQMTRFFTNYGFHPLREWMNKREASNPRATIYVHWMQDIHRQAKQTLENTPESKRKYSDPKPMAQPSIEVGDLGNVEWKKHMHQTPINEVMSVSVWPFQYLGEKGKPGLQLRYITMVENSSSIPGFLVGTLAILE